MSSRAKGLDDLLHLQDDPALGGLERWVWLLDVTRESVRQLLVLSSSREKAVVCTSLASVAKSL
jgi:hypothetical protein